MGTVPPSQLTVRKILPLLFGLKEFILHQEHRKNVGWSNTKRNMIGAYRDSIHLKTRCYRYTS
jgi:hypothetical protein